MSLEINRVPLQKLVAPSLRSQESAVLVNLRSINYFASRGHQLALHYFLGHPLSHLSLHRRVLRLPPRSLPSLPHQLFILLILDDLVGILTPAVVEVELFFVQVVAVERMGVFGLDERIVLGVLRQLTFFDNFLIKGFFDEAIPRGDFSDSLQGTLSSVQFQLVFDGLLMGMGFREGTSLGTVFLEVLSLRFFHSLLVVQKGLYGPLCLEDHFPEPSIVPAFLENELEIGGDHLLLHFYVLDQFVQKLL